MSYRYIVESCTPGHGWAPVRLLTRATAARAAARRLSRESGRWARVTRYGTGARTSEPGEAIYSVGRMDAPACTSRVRRGA